VPEARRGQLELLPRVVGLLLARQRGNLPTAVKAADAARPDLAEDLRGRPVGERSGA
jgi:hypothetical protein